MGKYRCLPTQVGLSDKIWGGWLDWWWWLYKQHWLNTLWPKHSSKGFISLGHVWLFAIPWIAAHQAYVHGILLTKILEWVVISYSRGSSGPRDRTWISSIAGRFFTVWFTREAILYVLHTNKVDVNHIIFTDKGT